MYRSVLFLLLIAAAALGAAWVADQTGNVILTWDGWRIETSLPVFALAVGETIVAAMLMWSILRGLWRTPGKIRRSRREQRHARGRHAITQGLPASGHGAASADRARAGVGKCRSRSVAPKRDVGNQAGIDTGAGRGARQQI